MTLVTLPGVEILATGTWQLSSGEATFTVDDLAEAIDAAGCPSIGSPILKLGHVDPRFDGEPAVGRVDNMRLTAGGNKITADLAGMPAWLGEVAASAYPNRSIEARRNVTCQQGHEHPFVITGLALLGVTLPGVGVLKSLEDVAVLYDLAASLGGQKLKIIVGGALMPKRKVSSETVRAAGRAISAAVQRGALSVDRQEHYVQQVFAAASDDTAREIVAAIDILHGHHGPGPGPSAAEDDAEAEDLETVLWPARTEAEVQRQVAAAARLAASAPAEDDEDFSALWPAETPEEAGRRIAASRRPSRKPVRRDDGWSDEDLHRAVFGDTTWTGPGHGPHNGGQP